MTRGQHGFIRKSILAATTSPTSGILRPYVFLFIIPFMLGLISTDLPTDVTMPPLNRMPFGPILETVIQTARKVHLIHVMHRPPRPGLAAVIRNGEIPTSNEADGYCGNHARFVESQIGHPNCIYFYVGRAHPAYGSVALAFSTETEGNFFQSATPFDSGGLVRSDADVTNGFKLALNPDNLASRVAYCKAALIQDPLTWRDSFAHWLQAYFPADARGYWTGFPLPRDPEKLYDSGNSWEAWTWEARLRRGPTVTAAEAWTCDIASLNEIDSQLNELMSPDDVSAMAEFRRRNLTPFGSATFCEELEAWTVLQCVSAT